MDQTRRMGFLDKFKKSAGKASGLVADNKDKVDDGIDKLAGVIDDKTGGKHKDKVVKGAAKAHDVVDKIQSEADKARRDPT